MTSYTAADPVGVVGAHIVQRAESDYRSRAVFANCRALCDRYQAMERPTFVPSADHEPPVPD